MASGGRSRHALNIVERPLPKIKAEIPTVSLSAMTYLLSELIQYAIEKASSTNELEDRLDRVGFDAGARLLELVSWRERVMKRKPEVLDMLRFIQGTVWPQLFGKTAEELQQGAAADDEYMIKDHELLLNRYTSLPRSYAGFNPGGALVAGIVRGMMETAGFPCLVTAHFSDHPTRPKPITTILIKLDQVVMKRQQQLEAGRRG
mmetsp:Transcript_16323/g.27984  ORF Transcript_16323/g.27984 Transcript_16323/m.27984 type:complete len:204 (+) Transcript_16323:148-759(+)|eukprot:CAMPEP_0119107410 /NCGR_PEP_ID=MMETSP1180-20130426/9891_1 /TAXON_ID=3052 ORGANISM="Chlamydomonas cf sp, Strain CCMP681" /NCGR_SAMPLE_ID=MMETSP1180 /ASSEMBLY_ACC=CAM_ASM_000741 /LENGTH=203 /DNA_ID=CAMNT_0007092893 /DNA_START=148 /DNA_END=759 /DNA_ORIENTATION=+